jgi:ubiquinone/menaquinone biosynthesis C-methylase UbiE
LTITVGENAPTPTVQRPFTDLFLQTIHAFHRTEALKAAIELDVFTAIGEGAETEEIARRCKASTRGIRILCDFLVMMGFLEKEKSDTYKLTPDSKAFLDKRSPYFVGGSVEFLLSPTTTDGFKDLASVVRTGTTTFERGGVLAPEHPVWVTYARAMTPLVKMPAELLVSMLGKDTTPSWKVLDIAAGNGLFGIAVAKRYPKSNVVAVDWQNILSIARENALSEGVADRYSALPGNAFEVELGDGYDVVLVPNFLHHFDLGRVEVFLSKIFKALKPGGRAVILEIIPNEDRVSPPTSVTFSLIMLTTTQAGNAYTYSEYQRVLDKVGFSKVDMRPLAPTPFGVIFAEK